MDASILSAALLSAAVQRVRSQDSSVMFSLTKAHLLLRKGGLLLPFPLPATTMALLLLSNGTFQTSEPSGAMWSPAKRYNRKEWSREPFSSWCQETLSIMTA